MDDRAQLTPDDELKAALDWWREAGVDREFSDEPTKWLAARPEQSEPQPNQATTRDAEDRAAPSPAPEIVLDRSSLPQDFGDFAEWWLTAPELDAGRTSGRVVPRGNKGSELMVLVPEPEREDREVLLSGPQGRLLGEILRAMGCDESEVYFASALPRHLPGADWQALAGSFIGDVLRHHIQLVSPRRLVAFGGNILPLIGNDLPQGPADLPEINLGEQRIPLLAARSLPALLDRHRWKDELWKAWLGWTDGAPTG